MISSENNRIEVTHDDGRVEVSLNRLGEVEVHATCLSQGTSESAVLGNLLLPSPLLPSRGDVDITLYVEPEHLPVRGNVCVTEDDEADEVEDAVLARLDRDDVWAWAAVTVMGRWGDYEASAHLGGCSYDSEDDFREDGYFQDLVGEVVSEIRRQADRQQRLDHIAERARQLAHVHGESGVRDAADRIMDVYKEAVQAKTS